MAKYRKKPVVIEAIRASEALHFAAHDWKMLPDWLLEAYDRGGVVFARDEITVTTLEGVMRCDAGDMLIRGVKGELYPCKPDVFAATYEHAGD
jgi:hypothetical protein